MKPSHPFAIGDRVLLCTRNWYGWRVYEHPGTIIAITPGETIHLQGYPPTTLPTRYKVEFDKPAPSYHAQERDLVLIDDANNPDWLLNDEEEQI